MTNPTRSTYHHGHLRPAHIAAARALLDAGGPDAVGLRETARRVGVSATATYRHFLDKESLLAAVATEGFQEFGQTLAEAMKDGAPFAAMGRAYIDFALRHPGLFRLMFSPILREREKFPELCAAADEAFTFGRANAVSFRASEGEDLSVTMIAGWSMVHGLAYLVLDRVVPTDDIEGLVEALLISGSPLPLPPKAVSGK